MSTADQGAVSVRPADVEDWFALLGLTPAERADRDGIASWDLVLDGRRRFDLRVTVILDPALGVICWAHSAAVAELSLEPSTFVRSPPRPLVIMK